MAKIAPFFIRIWPIYDVIHKQRYSTVMFGSKIYIKPNHSVFIAEICYAPIKLHEDQVPQLNNIRWTRVH